MEDLPEKSTGLKLTTTTVVGGGAVLLMAGQWMLMGAAADLLSSAFLFGLGFVYGKYFK